MVFHCLCCTMVSRVVIKAYLHSYNALHNARLTDDAQIIVEWINRLINTLLQKELVNGKSSSSDLEFWHSALLILWWNGLLRVFVFSHSSVVSPGGTVLWLISLSFHIMDAQIKIFRLTQEKNSWNITPIRAEIFILGLLFILLSVNLKSDHVSTLLTFFQWFLLSLRVKPPSPCLQWSEGPSVTCHLGTSLTSRPTYPLFGLFQAQQPAGCGCH